MTADPRPARAWRIGLVCAIAAVVVVGAALLRLWVGDATATLGDRFGVVLVAAAFLLAGLLAVTRRPRLGWALLTVASSFGAIEAVAVVRGLEPLADGVVRGTLTALGGALVLGAVAVAAGYASAVRERPSRIARIAGAVLWSGVALTVLAIAWAVSQVLIDRPLARDPGELTPLRVAVRVALATLVGALTLGIAHDVLPAATRAAARLRADPASDGRDRLWRFLGYLADELVPGRGEDRRRAAHAERARLAADLHALVLPDLRRAAASAPPEMQVDLRRALEDVEQLMHERQSIVLEQFGIVAALEWLAERTEERSPLRVELEFDGSVPDGADAIDRGVARAAFRIALLALDNVVRHANARTATVALSMDRSALRLRVEDDGATPTTFVSSSGRGVPDIRAEATGTGGSVEITSDPGARIEARWPIERALRRNATRPPADDADRSADRRP